MTITSNLFFLLTALWIILYYVLPKRFQWVILLICSYSFYLIASVPATLCLMFSTVVTFLFTKKMAAVNTEGMKNKEIVAAKRKYLVPGLIINLIPFAIYQYTDIVRGDINILFGTDLQLFHFAVPIGMAYYILQVTGYMLDVYWERTTVETNIFKYALFVSFFPQMFQGPVNKHQNLMHQLTEEHTLTVNRLKHGILRIVWGLFKIFVISEWAALYSDAIFEDPDKLAGITIFGVLLYTIELYGNFAGGIDVALGVSEIFGITLQENFKQPLFSVSIADFWRRWHVSLCIWMKDYVFYPLQLSRGMLKFQKIAKKIFGKSKGRPITIAVSGILTFLTVSMWHGLSWMTFAWGVYNGFFEGVGGIFVKEFRAMKKALHINDKSKGWHVFMVLRTFALFNIMNYTDTCSSFSEIFHIVKLSVTNFDPSLFLTISSGKLGTAYTPYALATILVGCGIWFFVSFNKEKGIDVRAALDARPVPLQVFIVIALLVCVAFFSPISAGKGFIYAQF